VIKACEELFAMQIRGQYVAAVLIEEKLPPPFETDAKPELEPYQEGGCIVIPSNAFPHCFSTPKIMA
jgi:hypothetical protein